MELFGASFVLICVIVFVLFNLPPFLSAMFQLSKEALVGKKPDDGNRYIIMYELRNGDILYLREEISKAEAEKKYKYYKTKTVYYGMPFSYERFKIGTNEEFDTSKVSLKYINPKDVNFFFLSSYGIPKIQDAKKKNNLEF